jgi:hypothetical protein
VTLEACRIIGYGDISRLWLELIMSRQLHYPRVPGLVREFVAVTRQRLLFPIKKMDAYKECIKDLTNEQLLDSREVLSAQLKTAEDAVSTMKGKLQVMNDVMAAKGMELAIKVGEQEKEIAELKRIQQMVLEALQVYYPSLDYC